MIENDVGCGSIHVAANAIISFFLWKKPNHLILTVPLRGGQASNMTPFGSVETGSERPVTSFR